MGTDITIARQQGHVIGHVSATVEYLQGGHITILQALDMELPDVLAAEVFPRLSLKDTFNLAQASRGLRDTAWSVQGVQSLRAKIGDHLESKGPKSIQLTRDPLFWAVWNDNLPAVRALIQAGENVSAVYPGARTPRIIMMSAFASASALHFASALHCAACKGYSAVVIELVKAGADVNATGTDGQTPLHVATRTGRALVVAVLLTAGADANKVDNEGRKPLEVVMKGRCPHHSNYSCNCGRSPNLPLSALRLLRQHTFA
jgi:hypothetical protein|tara:strand:- start:54 stop:833 length:780 start_codon:yes stop_codon:yes gene_type:complete